MKRSFIVILIIFSFVSQNSAQNKNDGLKVSKEKDKYSSVVQMTKYGLSNNILAVKYDINSSIITIENIENKKIFIRSGKLEGDGNKLSIESVRNSVFGNGKRMLIQKNNGGFYEFEIYPKIPFVFASEGIRNNNKEVLDIKRYDYFKFNLNIEKSPHELKTLGTGGLNETDQNPGSYVFLTVADPKDRSGVVAGWLTCDRGSGVFFAEVINDQIKINSRIDYGHLILKPKQVEKMETMVIGYFNDARFGQELFADLLAKKHNIKIKPRSAVYCTWYDDKHNGAGSEKSTIELTDFVRKNLKSFGLGVIQIDDLWQGGEKINGPCRGFDRIDPKGGYPNGMAKTAEYIKKSGLQAGLWWMPFARNHTSAEYKDRQSWFAKRDNGKPYETNWGGTSLDLTNPEVINHVSNISKILKRWGYTYFKMDGLWTGTVTEHIYINDGYKDDTIGNNMPLLNKEKTQIEAYRDGLKTIRKTVGKEQFLSGCCISQNMRTFGASIGLVDAMRIGPDNNHDGRGVLTGIIRGTRLYFLNGKIWWNDPDPVLVRAIDKNNTDKNVRGVKGDIENARLVPSWVALTGAFYLCSDWLPDLPKERIEIMKRCLAPHNATSRPVDLFDNYIPSIWITTDNKSGVNRNIIGIFNWDSIPHKIGTEAGWCGLNKTETYYAFDFWNNEPINNIMSSFEYNVPSMTCKVIALRAKSDRPVVVSTSRHVSQGIIDIKKEEWKNGSLSVISEIIGGDDYEVRIAGLNDGGNWKLKSLKIIDGDKNISIKSLPQKEKGWLRLVISSKKDCRAIWQAVFEKQ